MMGDPDAGALDRQFRATAQKASRSRNVFLPWLAFAISIIREFSGALVNGVCAT